eukprot:1158258-Pelagomonas_calceolata.AAC.3
MALFKHTAVHISGFQALAPLTLTATPLATVPAAAHRCELYKSSGRHERTRLESCGRQLPRTKPASVLWQLGPTQGLRGQWVGKE